MDIWPSPDESKPLFSPLETAAVQAPTDELTINENDVISAPQLLTGLNYQIFTPPTPTAMAAPSPELRNRCLTTPDSLDPNVRQLAERLFASCPTPTAKIRAVETYFRDHYAYRLDLKVPDGRDPLSYFLPGPARRTLRILRHRSSRPASAGGVPTRYVMGMLVYDRNRYGDYCGRTEPRRATPGPRRGMTKTADGGPWRRRRKADCPRLRTIPTNSQPSWTMRDFGAGTPRVRSTWRASRGSRFGVWNG
jgi:hypothetical protein